MPEIKATKKHIADAKFGQIWVHTGHWAIRRVFLPTRYASRIPDGARETAIEDIIDRALNKEYFAIETSDLILQHEDQQSELFISVDSKTVVCADTEYVYMFKEFFLWASSDPYAPLLITEEPQGPKKIKDVIGTLMPIRNLDVTNRMVEALEILKRKK